MSPGIILGCIAGYFLFLLGIAWVTSRRATNESYFLGNRASPWFVVAFGLIGDTLSGVTFISVPGQVATAKFSYFQIVLGNLVGYIVIAEVLLPLYYRLNLTSIYSYLRERFGPNTQKTGAFFFILSRATGAAARLFLAATVFQAFVFDQWRIPFELTVTVIIILMLAYTLKGGIKTLVWTDTFQSTFLLLGLVLSVWAIARALNLGPAGLFSAAFEGPHSQIFFWDWKQPNYFWKHFISGILTSIAMTGLDQNMMQKNLSCPSLSAAKKNIYAFTGILLLINALFLALGGLLYAFANARGIAVPGSTDQLFPLLAFNHLGLFAAVVFIFGLTAATFSSADSVLTTLTTSACIDFIGMERNAWDEARKRRVRMLVHAGFALLLLVLIVAFKRVASGAIITSILAIAGYTYGPLLGLFAYGLLSRRLVMDGWVPLVCVAAPLICYVLQQNSARWFGGYKIGFELLAINAGLTIVGLWVCQHRRGSDSVPRAETPRRGGD